MLTSVLLYKSGIWGGGLDTRACYPDAGDRLSMIPSDVHVVLIGFIKKYAFQSEEITRHTHINIHVRWMIKPLASLEVWMIKRFNLL